MRRMKKISSLMVLFCLMVTLCACGQKQATLENTAEPQKMEGMEHLLEYNTMGYFFGVYPELSKGRIELDSWSDTMQFRVESAGDNREFAVMFFLDYEQIPICIDGKDYEQYYINVAGNYSRVFDFQLAEKPDTDKIHKLTGILVSYSDVLMAEQDDIEFSTHDSIILNYELVIDKAEDYMTVSCESIYPEMLYDSQGSGIIVNCRTDELRSYIPDKEIRVKSGDTLTLQYHAGAFQENTFVMFVTAGYEQMLLNGKEYLFFQDLPTMQLAAGYLEMQVPDEPGSYEVIAYVIPQPFKEGSVSEEISSDSYRFTLVVE